MFFFPQKLQKRHVLGRRGKGEASFLHCKSPEKQTSQTEEEGWGEGERGGGGEETKANKMRKEGEYRERRRKMNCYNEQKEGMRRGVKI